MFSLRSTVFVLLLAAVVGVTSARPLAIVGSTIIDGTGRVPISNSTIVINEGRIVLVGEQSRIKLPPEADVIDGRGKYVIPGLMDANVHLLLDVEPEYLLKADGRYEPLIIEAAQIALKNGVTTVFDTWGPRQALVNVRDRINSGEIVGSRIYLAGNIIGFSGPMSADFFHEARSVVSKEVADKVDNEWEQGVGSDLLWMTPEEVQLRVREYIASGKIDLVKYASSGHVNMQFIAFSPEVQRVIVDEAHRAGLTAQAHSTSVESLKLEIGAGVDLLQHCDWSGPVPLPADLIKRVAQSRIPCAALVVTDRHLQWIVDSAKRLGALSGRLAALSDMYQIKDINSRNLIKAGAVLLLTTDAGIYGPSVSTSPLLSIMNSAPDLSTSLGNAHFLWLQAVQERGMSPMDALLSATRNIAVAYKKDSEIGTLEVGKRADLLVLDADPLQDVRNYRRIYAILKDGEVVDRSALPNRPVLTTSQRSNTEAELQAAFVDMQLR